MDGEERKSVGGRTLFVRNLPYSTTNQKLEELFGDIGPTRKCFVVKEKESNKCRGFGYVQFSVREDAENALKTVTHLEGRKLFVSFADAKIKKDKKGKGEIQGKAEVENKAEKKPQRSESVGKQKRRAACTVVVTGFKPQVSEEEVKHLAKDLKHVSELVFPAQDRQEPTAVLRCQSKKDAIKASKKLDGTSLKGSILKSQLLSQEFYHNNEKKIKHEAGKLIIRNLSFKCEEKDLREIFSKYGDVMFVKIPIKEGTTNKKLGYGFVQFSDKRDAAKAIKERNAKPIQGRPVAVDWAVSRNKYQSAKQLQQEAAPAVKEEGADTDSEEELPKTKKNIPAKKKQVMAKKVELTGDDDSDDNQSDTSDEGEDDDDEQSDTTDDGESDEEEETSTKMTEEGSNSEEEDEEEIQTQEKESDSESNDTDEASEDDTDSDKEDSTDEGFSDIDDSDEESNSRKSKKTGKKKSTKMQKSDVNEGKTVFIRNLSYDSMEEDIEEMCAEYGELAYCRLVIDPDTEHSRGSAFVQFKSKDSAEKFIQAAEENTQDGGLTLDGRRLNVTLAVSKDEAQRLKVKDKDKDKEVKDKRNLWLIREGLIRAGTQAAEGLAKADMAKRMKLEKIKRQKLKNPNIFVSTTRLSVHNLPTSIQDKDLKKICLKAAADKNAKINECRIMRDLNRVNAKGLGKSRGFAFVNFLEHSHALNALRNINNNPEIFGDKKRAIVEFSLENKMVLLAKEKKLERMKVKQESLKRNKQFNKNEGNMKPAGRRQSRGKKVTDILAPVPLAEGEDRSQIPKGLPKHWGPKIRHKPRGDSQQSGKNRQGKNTEHLKRSLPEPSEPPAAKRKRGSRGNRTEKRDDFDKLVDKYKQTFSKVVNVKKTEIPKAGKKALGKWFQ